MDPNVVGSGYWQKMEQDLKQKRENMLAHWKRKDEELKRYNEEFEKREKLFEEREKLYEEMKKYTQHEIDYAVQQIRIDRLKELLKDYVR